MDTTTDHFTPLALRVRGKKYGNKGWAFDYPVSAIWNQFLFCQDACQCLMLHPYITASSTIINIVLSWRGCNVYVISFLYSNVVLLKLHGCVVSHMQVLATTLLSVHNLIIFHHISMQITHWYIWLYYRGMPWCSHLRHSLHRSGLT